MIKLEHVSKSYTAGIPALNDVSLDIEEGEFVFIVGDSGSGKSTLIKLLLKELEPTEGTITINNKKLNKIKRRQIPKFRRNIGVVFQDFRLIDELTAKENILLPRLIAKKKIDMEYYHSLISMLGLEEREKHLPTELSGGQKQRVAIARALINDPDLILADEPTGNVDQETAGEIMDIFVQMHQLKKTVVIVTHDMDVAMKCENVIKLSDGMICES